MPDWDQASPQLRRNLRQLLTEIRDNAFARKPLRLEDAKHWHRAMMKGLTTPDQSMVGQFRGSRQLADVEVTVGSYPGVPATHVAAETAHFEATLQKLVKHLDTSIPPEAELNPDQLSAIIEASAWAHAEWVRIHPFANGNGRTARLWANAIAMRYHLPPFVRLRPRPNFGYEAAAREAMLGNRTPTTTAFHRMLDAILG